MEFEFTTIAPLITLIVLTGLLGGFLSGLLGIGGGFLLVPALYYCLSSLGYETPYLMHICIGTSLSVIVPTVLTSARTHYKRGSVDLVILKSWGPALILGTFFGIYLASILSSQNLTLIFASMALLTCIYMTASKKEQKHTEKTPKGWLKHPVAAGIGVLATLMGIGGAIISVPTMTAFNLPIKRAIGTAASMGVLTSSVGMTGFIITGWSHDIPIPFTFGFVNILASLLIIPASVFMAPYGARAAHKLPHNILKIFFAILLSLVSIRMFIQADLF